MKSKTTQSKYFGEVLVSFVLWHPASRNSQQFQSVWMRRNWPLNEIGGKRHHERLPPGLNKKCHFMAAIYRATVLAFRLSADETRTDAMSNAVTHKWHHFGHSYLTRYVLWGCADILDPKKPKHTNLVSLLLQVTLSHHLRFNSISFVPCPCRTVHPCYTVLTETECVWRFMFV